MVAFLCFCRLDVADGLQQSAIVEPVDPFQVVELDRHKASLCSASMDYVSLEETVDRLGQGIVVALADASDGGLDTGLGQALGVADADVLRSTVGMTNKAIARLGSPIVKRLLQGVEDEVSVGRPRHAPADNPAGKGVDDERGIEEAAPRGDIGEVADPQSVLPGRLELPVYSVERTGRGFVADFCLTGMPRTTPFMPMPLISRATVQRATSMPSRFIWRQTLRTADAVDA